MGIVNNILGGASGQGGYFLTNSLRFRKSASANLTRTPASSGNQKIWTFSTWVKRGQLGGTSQQLLTARYPTVSWFLLGFTSNDVLEVAVTAGSANGSLTSAVFRDPSAWYHIVLAFDTTQATAANRVKLYVNNVQQTFASTNYPAQNTDYQINQNVQHTISGYSGEFFDGYQTEINLIDGQALTPSSFGSTNLLTGVWQPRKYIGTYGTNGFYLPFNNSSTASFAGSFNGSNQSLSVAQNAAFSFGTGDFTVETFINANSWRSDANPIVSLGDGAVGGGSPVYTGWSMRYDTTNGIGFYRFDGAETFLTSGAFLNTGQWYHIAISRSGGVLKMFANGIQVYSAANITSYNNVNSNSLKIGGNWVIGGGVVTWVNGQISNTRIVKGTGLYTANFIPPTSNLTAVSGTSLLTLQNSSIVDNSTNAFTITNNNSVTTSAQNPFASGSVTSDQSGNANNWTPNNLNLATVGATYDSMTDVPTLTSLTTANYPVLNPLLSAGGTTANGNLQVTTTTGVGHSRATMAIPNSGKWYAEYTAVSAGTSTDYIFGIVGIDTPEASYGYNQTPSYSYTAFGEKIVNGSFTGGFYASFTTGDIIGCAVNLDTNEINWYKNGTLTGSATTITNGSYFWMVSDASGSRQITAAMNFGQRPFAYTPPTGFVALNTFNLPEPSIKAGNKQMDATLWTGDNTTPRSIANAGSFQPDFVWIKSRSNAYQHNLYDSVRGAGAAFALSSDQTAAEGGNSNVYGFLSAFNSTGFAVTQGTAGGGGAPNGNAYTNQSGSTYVAWQWKANGAAVTNTAGTVSAQVSANTTAGFSIATFTNTVGRSAFTVGHGLGVAPKMVIVKTRSATADWVVYHESMGATRAMYLNQTSGQITSANFFNNTAPTSSVVTFGSGTSDSGVTLVAYCWSEVAGFSSFGSYIGNGSADGPFVFTGFQPRFVMIKRSDTGGNSWLIYDTARKTFNADDLVLYPNLSNAEDSGVPIDVLSNGFKQRVNWTNGNANGGTYIYAAFAESPFKVSLAR
jgi:hypothetical protein